MRTVMRFNYGVGLRSGSGYSLRITVRINGRQLPLPRERYAE